MAVKKNTFVDTRIKSFILPSFVTGKKYYIYVHTRVDNGDPFYVGVGTLDKGKYSRAMDYKKRSKFWKYIYNKTYYNITIIGEYDTREEALKNEINYISILGKRIDKKGTLVNLTNGGDGGLGIKITWTPEMRLKASISASKRVTKDSTREKLRQNIYKSALIGRSGGESYVAKTTFKIDAITKKVLQEFPTIKAAADSVGVKHQSIGNAIKKSTQSKGYLWRIKSGK